MCVGPPKYLEVLRLTGLTQRFTLTHVLSYMEMHTHTNAMCFKPSEILTYAQSMEATQIHSRLLMYVPRVRNHAHILRAVEALIYFRYVRHVYFQIIVSAHMPVP